MNIFPTCEIRRLGARRSCCVSSVFETRATVEKNLRSRLGKKDSRALER